jgi:hypothetical protein
MFGLLKRYNTCSGRTLTNATMASNNNNSDVDNQQPANTATLEEDTVLASLGTTRAETSNYESAVLRQATHRLAPQLKVDDDSEEAFRFPDFISSTTLLPFSAPNQAKENRKAVMAMLAKIQTQMQQQMLSHDEANAGQLLAMKQQMLLSMLGQRSKKASIQDLWTQQGKMEELYLQSERHQGRPVTDTRRGRVSMMQHKQIPGASSLAKAQEITNKRRQKPAWKDWSSDDDNGSGVESELHSDRIVKALVAEMNYSRRRQQRSKGTSNSRQRLSKATNTNFTSKLSASMKPKRRKSEQLKSKSTATHLSNDRGRPTRRSRTPVSSYAEPTHEEDEYEKTEENNDDAPPTESDKESAAVVEEFSVKEISTQTALTNANLDVLTAQLPATNAAINAMHLEASGASGEVTCPLCQHSWPVSESGFMDEELSRHMAQCQPASSSCRRSRRPQKTTSYKEMDDEEDMMDSDGGHDIASEKRPPTRKKRLISATSITEEEELIDDADFLATENMHTENDDQFVVDDGMSDDADELQNESEEEAPLEKPTSLDDYRLDDYEDRVDYWKLRGVSEMRDMSQLRAEGETEPGAVSLSGGLNIPSWMNNRLFAYQRTGLEWMWTLHQQQAGGVMGDEMG